MYPSTMARKQAGSVLVAAFTVTSLQAQDTRQQRTLDDARQDVVAADIQLRKAASEVKMACDEADVADEKLLSEGLTPSTFTQTLAKVAVAKRAFCDQWKQTQAEFQAQAAVARQRLRSTAAADPSGEANLLATAPRPGGLTRAPSRIDLQAIVTQALDAQERVGKERAATQDVYETVDRATKAALKLTEARDGRWVERSQEMQAEAAAARTAAGDAQKSANKFVQHALTIHRCLISATVDCGARQVTAYESARAARDAMNEKLQLSKSKREQLSESVSTIEVAGAWKDDAQRGKALQFAKLVEKYPDANAPFAQNAFTLLASNKDKSAAIKLGWDRLYPGGWRQVSLSFSAPFGDRVLSYADGLTGLPKVGIGYQLASVSKAFGSESLLYSAAAGLKFGYDKRAYYEDGPTVPKAATDVRVSPWELSGAMVLHDASTSNSHVLRAAWQRTFEDGPTKNRCPSGTEADVRFVDCITGAFGAPNAREAGLFVYQYRYQTDAFAISPTLSYNTRSKVTEFGLPLYLVRSEDDDKRPFNAGIRADWISKGKESITGSTKNTWSFGVFVGTAFSLFSRNE